MSDNTLFSIKDGSENGEMYTKLNERSELERFRNQHSREELDDMAERFRGLWEPAFRENMRRDYPLHPWKVLKRERKRYAEEENGGEWPSMGRRHALRVVKDEFKEKWEEYSRSFNS